MITKAEKILNDVFGYTEFRPMQREVIDNVLQRRDTLAIMPTGGGKSLCYQIPALIFEGLTIVVSPLISLMKDQVEQLREFGVQAVYLNSSLSAAEYRENVELIRGNKIKLLYVAPETLLMDKTLELLSQIKISMITIDEAHCISEWGHDFRPVYRQIAPLRAKFKDSVLMALTATATPRVQSDISDNLKLKTRDKFIASFNRKNLFLQIWKKSSPTVQLLAFLSKHKNESGIIYCFSRNQVDELFELIDSRGFSVKPYHAGLGDKERKLNQELFIKDDIQIIVATIAFGMGINKPNVRFVIHFDLPKNIESYYQEIGRAGRDGLRANCILLFGYGDIRKINYFIDQKEENERRVAKQHLNALIRYAESYQCRRIPLLRYFGEDFENDNCGMCDNCNKTVRDAVDLTLEAQKFMSCMVRTKQLYGANHVIDVLRGSKNKKVIEKGHDKLSTYGVGTDLSKEQWHTVFQQLLQRGFIIQDLDYGSLKCTQLGVEVLKGERTFHGKLEKEIIVEKTTKYDSVPHDKNLFDLLRIERKRLADRQNIPPYAVFPDKTLLEMSAKYPTSAADLLNLYGVGAAKFNKYGNKFLRIIRTYKKENNIKPKSEIGSHKNRMKKNKLLKFEQVTMAYNSGKSIDEILEEFQINLEGLVRHLMKYNDQIETIDPERLMDKVTSDEDTVDNVFKLFEEKGTAYLRPVYDALEEKVSFIDLHILRFNFLFQRNVLK